MSSTELSQAGFPFVQLDRYLKILVQDMGKQVAISEEFANDASGKVKSGGLQFDRKVARIVTPGTLIDEKFIDPWDNNYLLCLQFQPKDSPTVVHNADKSISVEHRVGLAWLDLSTGAFFTQSTDLDSLASVVTRIGPREIVLDGNVELPDERNLSFLQEDRHVITFFESPPESQSASLWSSMFLDNQPDLKRLDFTPEEISAGSVLLYYVRNQLQGQSIDVQVPVRQQAEDYMIIDKQSLKGLEIRSTYRDNMLQGSLLHNVRRTVTKSGTRLLTERIGL